MKKFFVVASASALLLGSMFVHAENSGNAVDGDLSDYIEQLDTSEMDSEEIKDTRGERIIRPGPIRPWPGCTGPCEMEPRCLVGM